MRCTEQHTAHWDNYLAVCKTLASTEASAGWFFLYATTHLARKTTLSLDLKIVAPPAKLDIQSFDRRLRDVASLHC